MLVALLAVALIVGGATQIGRASGPYDSTVDSGYASLISVQVRDSTATGAELADFLDLAPSLDRTTFLATLASISGEARRQSTEVSSFEPPSPSSAVDSPCRAAFQGRAAATGDVQNALSGLIGGPTGTQPEAEATAIGQLTTDASALMAADSSWASCRQQLHRAPGHPRLPQSKWVTSATAWTSPALTSIARSILASKSLAVHHQLTLTVFSTTPPSLTASGTEIVPPTSSITVHLVITDSGDVNEPAVQVQASLVPTSGSPKPAPLTAIVSVGAGRSVTVVLGPFPVQPGAAYALDVVAQTPQGSGSASSSNPVSVAPLPPTTTTTTRPPATTTTTTHHG